MMKARFALTYDRRFLQHRIEAPSPENPDRLRNLALLVKERYRDVMRLVPAREARVDELEAVHSCFYLEQVREHSLKDNPYSYDPDTYLMEDSFFCAQLAAGSCLRLADQVMTGDCRYGYALIRPPGHHAEAGRGMGFCVLNNVAIVARYLQKEYGLSRILLLDFDVHHGNGTQEIFYESPEVLFISLHQRGLFPYSGEERETGRDEGDGYTINLPMHSHCGDREYTYLLGKVLHSVVEQYMPQIILVSAGYDGHRDDSISAMQLSTGWFGTVTSMLRQHADDCCDGRLLMVLEGGYNPLSLEQSVLASLDALAAPSAGGRIGIARAERVEPLLAGHPLREFWTI